LAAFLPKSARFTAFTEMVFMVLCCYLVNVSTGGSQCGLKRPHPTSACLSGGKVSVNN